MPPGRPWLPPEVKAENTARSRQRYEQQNADKRREDARLRMRRKRAAMAAGDPIIYDRKREEEWIERVAAAALRWREGQVEAKALRRKHVQLQGPSTPTPVPATKKAKRLPAPPKDLLRVVTPVRRGVPSTSPTPAPALKKVKRLPGPGKELSNLAAPSQQRITSPHPLSDIAQDDDDDITDSTQEDDAQICRVHRSLSPVFEQRVVCNEGCPGCASRGRALLPHLQEMWGGRVPWIYVDFCIPTYKPDPGHEDRDVHDKAPRASYYVIVSKYWSGVVSSQEAAARELKRDLDARTFTAPTWRAAMDWWKDDCQRRHNHHEDSEPESSPNSSPCSLVSAAFPCASVSAAFARARSASPTKIKSHRTPSLTKAISPSPTRTMAPIPSFPGARRSPRKQAHATEYVVSQFESWFEANKHEPPLLYGVSGHNRVFQDWDHAWATMKRTPGADLIFAHDEATVQEFVRTEAARMLEESKT
ncbi:hypothetical protein C8R45DRAFT_920519 [Mycena sanguinolenta]|nr:hypothetical protein C8R45DRAFT_920519 [Mycena sanguinolenta]